jgi:hypothetical protein
VGAGQSGDDDPETGTGELAGGFRCGGAGGHTNIGDGGADGENAPCAGGGGGGGESYRPVIGVVADGHGGRGAYGGGGGGGGFDVADGGDGGFGGGDGSGATTGSSFSGFGPIGGDGGFGAGGGAGHGGFISGGPGSGGSFGGKAARNYGGGGAGLGGAIFNHLGTVKIYNSTFHGNFAVRGLEGGEGAGRGHSLGGAIFSVDGALEIYNSTLNANETTSEGAAIVVYRGEEETSFKLHNTIIAGNLPSVRECFFVNSVAAQGSGNLITNNFGCPGAAVTTDPGLGPLQLNHPA